MKKGFTLIELMIVIAIIGILSAVALSWLSCDTNNGECDKKENKTGQVIKS